MKNEPVHGVGLIIDTGNSLLLQKRDNKDGIMWPGKVSSWGGAVEVALDNQPVDAMLREIQEELGLEKNEIELRPLASKQVDYITVKGESKSGQFIYFVAHLKDSTRFLHIYEGSDIVEIPYDFELSSRVISFTPDAVFAIQAFRKWKQYET